MMYNKVKCYKNIVWDISGTCNARCRYCITGRRAHTLGGFIHAQKFAEGLDILLKNNLADNRTVFSIFNWGEPTINPEFDDILKVLNNKNVFYGVHSNGGKLIDWSPAWFTPNLQFLKFSMCGFSQTSYDRIHQLDLETVKENICRAVKTAKAAKYNLHRIYIGFHIYQFNREELPEASRFAKKLGIQTFPVYASINDPEMLGRFLDGTLNLSEWKDIVRDLYAGKIFKGLERGQKINTCPQFESRLTIDESGNINPCCSISRDDSSFIITNIYKPHFMQELAAWQPGAACKRCFKDERLGIQERDFYFHPVSYPDFVAEENVFCWTRLRALARKMKRNKLGAKIISILRPNFDKDTDK